MRYAEVMMVFGRISGRKTRFSKPRPRFHEQFPVSELARCAPWHQSLARTSWCGWSRGAKREILLGAWILSDFGAVTPSKKLKIGRTAMNPEAESRLELIRAQQRWARALEDM